MQTASCSWRVVAMTALGFLAAAAGCSVPVGERDIPGEETGEDPDPDPLPETTDTPAECPGQCVPKPQGPFNSDVHLVAFGVGTLVPDCPGTAPHLGFLAQVVTTDMNGQPERSTGQWLRECLITTDPAPCEEGETCAPVPDPDYELCTSREVSASCPQDFYPFHVLAQRPEDPPDALFTLCCTRQKRR